MKKKIPYSGDLTPIEQAVWAAEYVRVRGSMPIRKDDAFDAANNAVAELKALR